MGFKCSSFVVLLIVFLFVCDTQAQDQTKVFPVTDFDAVADGSQDNSEAFLKAWEEACKWEGKARVYIPAGTYQLNHLVFVGPCNGEMEFVIEGVLEAPTDHSSYHVSDKWINFQYISGLNINGGGTLDGQGPAVWSQCQPKHRCSHHLPTNMRLDFVNNSNIESLSSLNSKGVHFVVFGSNNVSMSDIKISAPGHSPNTDGIKIAESHNIKISKADIRTGDDCVAMLGGIQGIEISEVFCGPGHGISIGSLADRGDINPVIEISVRNCTFHHSTNGIRLKTWETPYRGIVSNLIYEDIVMDDVENPIIIDQRYCPHHHCNREGNPQSHVSISNVLFKNIRGTSKTEYAISLRCSQDVPCKDIRLEDIYLIYKSLETPVKSRCYSVTGVSQGLMRPPSCF